MARPLGVLLFVGLALVSIIWSVANVPEPTVTLAYTGDPGRSAGDDAGPLLGPLGGPAADADGGGSDLVDVLANAGFESREDLLLPVGPGLEAGLYRVAALEPTRKQRKATSSAASTTKTGTAKTGTAKTGTAKTGTSKGKKDSQLVLGRGGKARPAPTPDNVDLRVEGVPGSEAPVVDRGEIEPGLYATAYDTAGCSYQLTRVMVDRSVALIGEDSLAAGRMLVNINEIEPDWFTSSPGCGAWYRWTPLRVPLNRAANGDYWVGDLAKGVWQVPAGCRWEKVVSFRGAMLHDVTAYGKAPSPLVVDDETFGLRVRGCTSELTLDLGATEHWLAEEALRAETGQRGGDQGRTTSTQAKAKAKPKAKRKATTTTAAVAPAVAPAEAPAPEPTPAPAPEPAPTPAGCSSCRRSRRGRRRSRGRS